MELPFYHDDSFLLGYNDLKAQKQPMNMPEPFRNLNHGPSLKLAAPELERLISAQNSLGVLTSPTPTQCQYGSRAGVTDEQEGFAEGFVKALDELHKIHHVPPPNVSIGAGAVTSAAAFASSLQPEPPCYTTLSSYCPAPGYPPPDQRFVPEEPQIVPDMHSSDGSPPVSPIDMENQERIKAERKRLRNRLAATKCRKRKLERIARLEDKVKVLKSDNAGLSSAASALREQVAQLKQKVMRHVNSGCQLMLTSKTEAF